MDSFISPFIELLKRDRRYKAEAYTFVYEVLGYAQRMGLGQTKMNEPLPEYVLAQLPDRNLEEPEAESGDHITGQDLCIAAREYAVSQYGFLAKTVLDSVGIHKTDDIGEIVYNLIGIGQMRKTPEDHREDFNNVYDFNAAFTDAYHIHTVSESPMTPQR